MSQQKKLLDRFYKHYGNFRVAFKNGYGFWSHFIYPEHRAKYAAEREDLTDRIIFKDEIVIESDLPMRKMNRGVTSLIENKLLKYHISFSTWFSGGKSYHIHVNMPELMLMQKEDVKMLKELFIKWIYEFDIEQLHKHKIDLMLCGNHLIRLEGAPHPETNMKKTLYSDSVSDEPNKIPLIVWNKLIELKNKPRYIYTTHKFDDRPCLIYLATTKIEDCRERIFFVLYCNYKRYYGVDKAVEFMMNWNELQGNHLSKVRMNAIMRGCNKNNMAPSCRYIKNLLEELGVDVCKSCRV